MPLTTLDTSQLLVDLIRDEGERLKPYRDTVGKETIGIGRNLTDVGISFSESRFLAQNDIARVCHDLDEGIPWWRKLEGARQRVLANMCFNLGADRLLPGGHDPGFPRTLALIQAGKYDEAATAMLDSLWAKQVGPRATRLSDLMKKGGA